MPESVFPENEVEVIQDYFPDFLEELVAQVSNVPHGVVPLTQKIEDTIVDLSKENEQAARVDGARVRLLDFLRHPSLSLWKSGLYSEQPGEEGVYELMKNREFARALQRLEKLEPDPDIPEVTSDTLAAAQETNDIEYSVFTWNRIPSGPLITNKEKRILSGYKEPKLDDVQIGQLFSLQELVKGGPEHTFRVGLLSADCLLGEARSAQAGPDPKNLYERAVKAYSDLLPALGPGTDRWKFVAIRQALALLAKGDFLFRRAFRFSSWSERDEVTTAYADAKNLMELSLRKSGKLVGQGPWSIKQLAQQYNLALPLSLSQFIGSSSISPKNPLRNQIELYANQQIKKIEGGYNFLGYRDSYVPVLTVSTLATFARNRVDAATAASGRFENFKTRTDELVNELAQYNETKLQEEIGVRIASEREAIAQERLTDVQKQIDRLVEKEASLGGDVAAGLTTAVFAAAIVGSGGVAAAAVVPAMTSAYVTYSAQSNELSHQQRTAEIERRIAARDITIANLETTLYNSRLDFVKECIRAKEAGADRLFALANAYEDMTRRHVQAAFEFLYLMERAISFRRLMPSEWKPVEGTVTQQDLLLAPATLNGLLTDLEEQAKVERGQVSNEPAWSLRLRHPIEFNRFLQTGEAEFVISLYEAEKHMNLKGYSNVRIKKVGVEVVGVVPSTGWSGTLIHRGTMLFRDKDSLRDRFLPTDAQLGQAINDLENGKKDSVAVGGVAQFALEQGALRISSGGEVTDQAGEYNLTPIETYGVTGTWYLKIERLGSQLRNVADVRLKFALDVGEFDQELEKRIEQLVRLYENELADNDALDEIRVYSLKTRFEDTFSQLESSLEDEGTFLLEDADFPPDITDLYVKTVVVQALDEDDKGLEGIEIEISKPGTVFALTRTTVGMGFSEDVTAKAIPTLSQPDRPPIQGTWQIRLLKPEQFAQLGDLKMFFLHEYKEKEV